MIARQIPVVTSADLIAAGDQSGWTALRRATMPATWGVAIDVPLLRLYALSVISLENALTARIDVPGAAISGCVTYP